MIVSVASGKGGTGKTTVAVNMALSIKNVALLDCDVEEPNCHIFLDINDFAAKEATTLIPEIDRSKCSFCGECAKFCSYNALVVADGLVMEFPQLCHSCGGCVLACPENAIREVESPIGTVFYAGKEGFTFIYGLLDIGQAMSSPLIRKVKKTFSGGCDAIVDCPPGTSCATISAVEDSDYCILVTEPTPFGLNDLELAVGMLKKMGVPFGVIINQDGVGDDRVHDYCVDEDIDVLLRIPHDPQIARLYSMGRPFVDEMPEYSRMFCDIFEDIRVRLK